MPFNEMPCRFDALLLLLSLGPALSGQPLFLPLLPASLAHVLFDRQVPQPKRPRQRRVQSPSQPPRLPQNRRGHEPRDSHHGAGNAASNDLPCGVVVEVYPAPRRRGSEHGSHQAEGQPLRPRPMLVHASSVGALAAARAVANQEEQRERDAPKGDKLRVRAGHAVAFAVDAPRALLLDQALQRKVERLAGQLAGEAEADFHLARGEDEGRVDDAEGLREEGEVCADEGEAVVRVLDGGTLVRLIADIEMSGYLFPRDGALT